MRNRKYYVTSVHFVLIIEHGKNFEITETDRPRPTSNCRVKLIAVFGAQDNQTFKN